MSDSDPAAPVDPTEPNEPPPKPKVVESDRKPCGCVVNKLDNGQIAVDPCLADGIFMAGNSMIEAGNFLHAAGRRLAQMQQERAAQVEQQRIQERKDEMDRAIRGRR